MSSEIAVTIENISKYYKLYDSPRDRLKETLIPFSKNLHRDFYALRNISFDVRKGEILGIVGRNGAGKSTLLKILARVLLPSSGKITINGSISTLLELRSGLNPEFTGLENIYFHGTMLGFSREKIHRKVEEIAEFADIGDFIHQPVKTYSSGMTARLAFAVAIGVKPDILIVDEVLAVGDELFKRKCYAKMEELFHSHCTVFFVSHSANAINELCSRAILLDKGELILEGPPKLVTMFYQKLLLVKPQNVSIVRNEILELNNNNEAKRDFALHVETSEETPFFHKEEQQKATLQAYYVPDFLPESTLITKNYDVEIYDMHIRTLDGKKVNVLVMNEEYIYSYKVRFNMMVENINFAMSFRNIMGIRLGWNIHPGIGRFIGDTFHKGTNYEVTCCFTCKLLPGTYFISICISHDTYGEHHLVQRIRDATVFKVQEISNGTQGGFFSFDQRVNIVKLD